MRVVALGVLVVVVSACSSSSDDSPVGATTAAPTAAAVTTAAPVPVTSVPGSAVTTVAANVTAPMVAELLTRPIVLAHAGGDDDYPHSTPFAFAESVKAGVDVLDLDVRLSADGVLVVQHDQDLQRTTNSTDQVASHTYAELNALDNAYWFNTSCNTCKGRPESDYPYRGIRTGAKAAPAGYTPDDFIIPTFRDIANRYPDKPLNIEIKGTIDDGIGVPVATALAAELKDLGRAASTVVTSFDDGVLAAFHQLAPDIALSPGLQATTAWVLGGTPLPDGMRILQIPPKYEGLQVLTPDLIARAKAAGYPIWVWPNGQNENETGYRDYFAMGLEGVNASKPAQGVAAKP